MSLGTSKKKVSRSASKRVVLSPEEAARARAAHILELRKQIDELENELDQETQALTDYVLATGETDFGQLVAIQRLNPPKLVGASGKTMEAHVAQLILQFPGYVLQKLNLTGMLAAWETDHNLKNALKARFLEIKRESSWSFKAAKSEGQEA